MEGVIMVLYKDCLIMHRKPGTLHLIVKHKFWKSSDQCQHVGKGWPTPMALIQIPWELPRLTYLKAGIVPGWLTCLALNFQCTLPPMIHPTIVEYPSEPDIFNQPCGKLRACLGANRLVTARSRCSKRCSYLKGGSSHWRPLILVMPVFKLHVD